MQVMSTKESIFGLIFIFALYLITRIPFFLLGIFFMLPYIVRSIFRAKNYSYKIYYRIIFAILLIQGLGLLYLYLFRSVYLQKISIYLVYLIFILFIIGYIMLIVYYTNHYFHRKENEILP